MRIAHGPHRIPYLQAGALVAAILLGSAPARPDEAPRGVERVEIGGAVPDFALKDLDGKEHRLSSYRGKKAVILAWNGATCPISKLYLPRLEEMFEKERERGVAILGVNSSRQDQVAHLRALAGRTGARFPILKDHGNTVADLLGVERTTEVLLLDSSLVLRYRGRLDDQYTIGERSVGTRKEHPEKPYLAEALDAVLRGGAVPLARTEPVGCIIGREPRAKDGASVTFHGQVEGILQRRCQSCHREGQIAPFPLLTYDDAAGWAGMIGEVVENRRMPPWHANPAHGKFSNDRSLPADERAALIGWVEAGAPRGDPSAAPPPASFPAEWQIGEPDAIFEMPRAFQVPAEGKVRYQHFNVETRFKEDRWVEAMEIRAGSREVVHHILVFAIDPKNPGKWRHETGGGFSGYFAVMVPGERPMVYEPGLAKRLPAGAILRFQVHYTTNGHAAEDRSRIGMIFAKQPVRHEVHTLSAFQLALRIPAASGRHEVKSEYTFRKPARLLSLLPHMHLRGEAFRYEAHFPARVKVSKPPWSGQFSERVLHRLRHDEEELVWLGDLDDEAHGELLAVYDSSGDRRALDELRRAARSEVLLDVPSYDFGWQSTYVLAEPREIPAGTLLECTAVYNNSSSNPALTRDMWEKPVRWGDQTWQEMMIGYFDCVFPDEVRISSRPASESRP